MVRRIIKLIPRSKGLKRYKNSDIKIEQGNSDKDREDREERGQGWT